MMTICLGLFVSIKRPERRTSMLKKYKKALKYMLKTFIIQGGM